MTRPQELCFTKIKYYEIQSIKRNSLHYCVQRDCTGLEILSPSFDIWSTQLFFFLPPL